MVVAARARALNRLGDSAIALNQRLVELRSTATAGLRARWEEVRRAFEEDLEPVLAELRPAHEKLSKELRSAREGAAPAAGPPRERATVLARPAEAAEARAVAATDNISP